MFRESKSKHPECAKQSVLFALLGHMQNTTRLMQTKYRFGMGFK